MEFLIGIWFLSDIGVKSLSTNLLILEGVSFGFGIYFWLFMEERLPAYYDENKVNAYSHGVFRMNVPGVYFNNSNWPSIVKCLRIRAAVTMVSIPAICLLLSALPLGMGWSLGIQGVTLVLYLSGMFVPLYIVGSR